MSGENYEDFSIQTEIKKDKSNLPDKKTAKALGKLANISTLYLRVLNLQFVNRIVIRYAISPTMIKTRNRERDDTNGFRDSLRSTRRPYRIGEAKGGILKI